MTAVLQAGALLPLWHSPLAIADDTLLACAGVSITSQQPALVAYKPGAS